MMQMYSLTLFYFIANSISSDLGLLVQVKQTKPSELNWKSLQCIISAMLRCVIHANANTKLVLGSKKEKKNPKDSPGSPSFRSH